MARCNNDCFQLHTMPWSIVVPSSKAAGWARVLTSQQVKCLAATPGDIVIHIVNEAMRQLDDLLRKVRRKQHLAHVCNIYVERLHANAHAL